MSKKHRQSTAKPEVKVGIHTTDSFQNFAASLGINTDNLNSASTYGFNFLTKNRILLEAMYRGSWIIAAAVDIPADDMTSSGISMQSELEPKQIEKIDEALQDLQIWHSLNCIIKWAALYGTCLGLLMIDGQDFSTPLNMDSVGKGQFKGILPIDRWQVVPSISDLITELSPDMGMPKYYTMVPDAILPNLGKIHHTRLIRYDAIELPHYQKMVDTLWGESIIERLNDRIIAFDSTTTGVAQLVYRAYLRTWSIENLRDIIAAGGPAAKGLEANIRKIRQLQASEGITLVDSKDKFETHQYSFAGLDTVLLQFGQQLSGALEIPLVRFFGQAPAGLNSTGESDLQIYYNGTTKKQNNKLRRPLKTVLELISRSVNGEQLPDGFKYTFNPLWAETNAERATIGKDNTDAIMAPYEAGVTDRSTTLKELRQASPRSGLFTNITDEQIKEAENDPPPGEIAQQAHEQREGLLNGQESQEPVGEE